MEHTISSLEGIISLRSHGDGETRCLPTGNQEKKGLWNREARGTWREGEIRKESCELPARGKKKDGVVERKDFRTKGGDNVAQGLWYRGGGKAESSH